MEPKDFRYQNRIEERGKLLNEEMGLLRSYGKIMRKRGIRKWECGQELELDHLKNRGEYWGQPSKQEFP